MSCYNIKGIFNTINDRGDEIELKYQIEGNGDELTVKVCHELDCITETINAEDYSGVEGILNWIMYDVAEQYFWHDPGCIDYDTHRDSTLLD